jgi:outer membrane lipoprotein LolB
VRFASLLALILALQACSILKMKSDKAEQAWQQRRQAIEKIDRFTVEARISAGLTKRGQLIWRQRPDAFDMRVAGPFGVGAASINGRGNSIEIRTAKRTFTTTDPERDLQERLGWTFPLEHLRYWVLGVPAPGSDADVEYDNEGRLTTLEQDDWTLEVDEYQDAGELELPRKFEVANDDVRIKVVVDRWSDLPKP